MLVALKIPSLRLPEEVNSSKLFHHIELTSTVGEEDGVPICLLERKQFRDDRNSVA